MPNLLNLNKKVSLDGKKLEKNKMKSDTSSIYNYLIGLPLAIMAVNKMKTQCFQRRKSLYIPPNYLVWNTSPQTIKPDILPFELSKPVK